jgi:hypothetical protein
VIDFVARFDRSIREQVAQRWLASARAEHASIAAFNRFSLQLLAVGAPAALLEACQCAALDEIHHARLCFEIASTYAGEAFGPAELPIDRDALTGFDLDGVVRGTIEEGCVGETLAALEAEAARDLAEHADVAAALDRIRRDESSHAELAFGAVRWALTVAPTLLPMARVVFDETIERHRRDARLQSASESDLARHGVLPEAQRQRVRARAIDGVLILARAALLGT